MRVAVIPPPQYVSLVPDGYHLILPQHLRHEKYMKHYVDKATGFRILDNGAAEGETELPTRLMRYATKLQVDEVVIPDVLKRREQTLQLVNRFHTLFAQYLPGFYYAAVVQGETYEDAMDCAKELVETFDYITTISIPKHLVSVDPEARIKIARYISDGTDKDIHFLGANSEWPQEVQELSKIPGVRGIDTSLPLYAASMGRSLRNENEIYGISRPKDYFDVSMLDEDLALDNIEVYKEWANG